MRFHPKLPPTLANLGILREGAKTSRGEVPRFFVSDSLFSSKLERMEMNFTHNGKGEGDNIISLGLKG